MNFFQLSIFGSTSHSCRGNITLYALILLPMALSVMVAAVDLSGAFALRDQLQHEADHLALSGAQLLPHMSATQSLVDANTAPLANRGIAFLPSEPGDSSPYFLNESVLRVTLESSYQSSFDSFLPQPLTFKIRQTSIAEVVPTDTVIILALGSSLRPPLGEAWGNPGWWPASGYFTQVQPPAILYNSDGTISTDYTSNLTQRNATQSCFNPLVSPMKFLAISLIDVLGSSSENRISTIFTPGEPGGLSYAVARHIHGETSTRSGTAFAKSIGGFANRNTVGAEAYPETLQYIEGGSLLGDYSCALLSTYDTSGTYSLPPSIGGLGLKHAAKTEDDIFQCSPVGRPQSMSCPFSSDYLNNNLRLREAVYWRSVRSPEPGFSSSPDILGALRQALLELAVTGSSEVLKAEESIRGNLAYKPLKQIVLLTDTLPTPDAQFADIINNLKTTHIQLLVGAFTYRYSGAVEDTNAFFQSSLPAIQALDPSGQSLRIISIANAEQAQTTALPEFIRFGHQVVLRQ